MFRHDAGANPNPNPGGTAAQLFLDFLDYVLADQRQSCDTWVRTSAHTRAHAHISDEMSRADLTRLLVAHSTRFFVFPALAPSPARSHPALTRLTCG